MDKAWESGALGTPPATPMSFSTGYPTEGDLLMSIPPTNPGSWWFHMITSEILAVLVAAGITPDPTVLNQLLAALDARYASGGTAVHVADFTGSNQSLAVPGYQKLPGGLILQWATGLVDGPGSTSVSWPITFPTTCFGAVATSNDTFHPTTPVGVTSVSTSGCVIDCESSSDTPIAFILALGH